VVELHEILGSKVRSQSRFDVFSSGCLIHGSEASLTGSHHGHRRSEMLWKYSPILKENRVAKQRQVFRSV
jgi:hypothetical protein